MRAILAEEGEAGHHATWSLATLPLEKATGDDDEVLVKVNAAGITPSDLINSKGGFPDTTYPRILGRDLSGTILHPEKLEGVEVYASGGGAFGFKHDGTFAEFVRAPKGYFAPKPSNLSHAQATVVGVPWTTAALCLRRAGVGPDDRVLVLGCTGSVGSAAVQLAKHVFKAARVTGAGRGERAGVQVDVEEDPGLSATLRMTGGKGPDVIIDTTGSTDLLEAALNIVAERGRIVTISAPRGGASTSLNVDVLKLYRKGVSLLGVNSVLEEPTTVARELQAMNAAFEIGALKPADESSLTKIGLEQVQSAFKDMEGKTRKRFVIVNP